MRTMSSPTAHPLAPEWLSPRQNTDDLEVKLFPADSGRNDDGELILGGLSAKQLAVEYGTPLYVISEKDFRARARRFREAFAEAFSQAAENAPGAGPIDTAIYYAGKAFLSTRVAQWALEEGLCVDTASGGELAIALAAGVPGERIGLHGNNKSAAEITRALQAGVGRIIADSTEEITRISEIASGLDVTAPVMLRLTPGVHASTHEYIATAHEDQKFGLSLTPLPQAPEDQQNPYLGSPAWNGVQQALAADSVELIGLHCHIGSQIFEPTGFEVAAAKLISFLARVQEEFAVVLPELDLGGGHGIAYTEADSPRDPEEIAGALAQSVVSACQAENINVPALSFEPGRAIVGPAGVTLYEVGVQKDVVVEDAVTRRYIAVDGGMSDNARTVLYDADYSAVLASRHLTGEHVLSRIVGKHCESGDIVVRNVYLPAAVTRGDILAVPATGAYCHSLSSNYNYLTRPAVVAVSEGESQLLIRRETEEQMLSRDTGFTTASAALAAE